MYRLKTIVAKSPLVVSMASGSAYLWHKHKVDNGLQGNEGHDQWWSRWSKNFGKVGQQLVAPFGLREVYLKDVTQIDGEIKPWFVAVNRMLHTDMKSTDTDEVGNLPKTYGNAAAILVDNKEGYLVTSLTSVGDSKSILVYLKTPITSQNFKPGFSGHNRPHLLGKVVHVDPSIGLALIKVCSLTQIAANKPTFQSGYPPEGLPVLVVGIPNLETTFNDGIISCSRRQIDEDLAQGTYQQFQHINNANKDVIQHCAPLTPTFIGGPLLDMEGKLLGITAQTGPTADISFAVPADQIQLFITNGKAYENSHKQYLRHKHLKSDGNFHI